MSSTHKKKMNSEYLYMDNLSTFKILGFRKVILNMTFEKLLTLCFIDIWMNLMFDLLLSENCFKLVSKSRMSIREGYLRDDFFKMNVMNIVTMNEKKIIIIIIIHILLIYLNLMTCGMTR